jgi:spore coat protein U-like protein
VVLALLFTGSGVAHAATTATVQVSASIVAGCVVTSTGGLYGTLNFGTYSALSTAAVSVALAGGVTLQCTPGVSVSMVVDGGLHNASGRHLKVGSGTAQIAYQLFQDAAHSQNLGIAQSVNVPYTNASAIRLPIFGYVLLPGNQPVGTYSDTLQVQLSY